MSQAMRKLSGAISKSNCVVIFINQLREKVGVMYGNPEVTPGGRALKFYSSVRIEIRKVESLKNGSEVYGNRVRCKVVKNKVAPPFKTAEFDILYGHGICKSAEILDVGLKLGFLEKSGSWFSYDGQRIGQGKDKARAYLESQPEVMKEIEEKIKEKYRTMDPDEGIPEGDGEEDFDLREFDGDEE